MFFFLGNACLQASQMHCYNRVPLFVLKFAAIPCYSQSLPTVDEKYCSTSVPLVLFDFATNFFKMFQNSKNVCITNFYTIEMLS